MNTTPWLEQEYITFAKHHTNAFNFKVHVVSLPLLLASVVVVTSHLYGTLITVPTLVLPLENVNLTFGFFFIMTYFVLYLFLDLLVAISLCPILFSVLVVGEFFTAFPYSFEICLILYNLCWSSQILAHIFVENSLGFENFASSFVLAPLFVWVDILCYFGFGPAKQAELKEKLRNSAKINGEKQHNFQSQMLMAIALILIVATVTAAVVLLSQFFSFPIVLGLFIVAMILLQTSLVKCGY